MRFSTVIAGSLLGGLAVAQTSADNNNYLGVTTAQRSVVDLATAQKAIEGGITFAKNTSYPYFNLAVTDPSGLLVAFARMDSAFPGSIEISQKKARTVSLFNGAFTTSGLYNNSQPGMPLYGIEETNGGLIVFGGGIPLIINGVFLGGIGVSGGSVDQDIAVATAAAKAVGGYVASS